MTPTLDPIRHTPPTLMLHRKNLSFDSVQFLKDFIVVLKQNNMCVITYQKIGKNPEITATQQGKLFIITIDDIYLRYPIDPSVLEMIALLRQAGYPAVLGVVTESAYAYPETARTLKELSAAGWEIASHTDQHSNLGVMAKTAPRYVYTEVQTSVDKIEKAVGVVTHTLVLPEGQMVNDSRFIKRAGIVWIVGINGGDTYDIRKDIVYVGREGPDGTAEQTFKIMMGRFNPGF
jgi:peptidoglycan/xylan/chitin deacetylase (PgdA/CDA1 family)